MITQTMIERTFELGTGEEDSSTVVIEATTASNISSEDAYLCIRNEFSEDGVTISPQHIHELIAVLQEVAYELPAAKA